MDSTIYEPLDRIIFLDDFDNGLNGWTAYAPNLRQDEMEYYPLGGIVFSDQEYVSKREKTRN